MHTWHDAVLRWRREKSQRAAETQRREWMFFRWVDQELRTVPLHQITRPRLLELREEYRAELDAHGKPRSNRSANYFAQTLTAVLRAAFDWGWLPQPPPRLKKLPEGAPRDRWLTPEQAEDLFAALPSLVGQMARLAVATGLRKGNVCGLLWSHVDLDRKHLVIPAVMMKARRPLVVPLSPEAMEVIAARAQARKEGCPLVFHTLGYPMSRPDNKAWRAVLKAKGLGDFRWHDLRHTWASWMAQASTPPPLIKQLGGWQTLAMVDRYAHLDTKQSRDAVLRMARWRRQRGPMRRAA